ncbi:MAG: HD domain-containing protein, partial [Candidatus Zixiibacteriota bacterium]
MTTPYAAGTARRGCLIRRSHLSFAKYADAGRYHNDVRTIVYCNAYRRLAHKSQIIVKPIRDHFRSRLTHTEEVNQIAIAIGRDLELNLELIEAIAKAHDLGHTPFGHTGERALQGILKSELDTRFEFNKSFNLKKQPHLLRRIFHHSSNSARILVKHPELREVQRPVIQGVLHHSWSPWK